MSDSDDNVNSGSEGEGGGGMERRLERARAAAQAARDILHYHPETRRDLRQVSVKWVLLCSRYAAQILIMFVL